MKTLLAVSGGIDSMCMADMYSRAGEDFAVAHCNFHLRGEESDGDAALVERWARSHGVRFFRADFDTASYAASHGVSIEMAARDLRYRWFARVAETEGFDAVATAHNACDNAETLVLNLLRGTGSRGLRGMAPCSNLTLGNRRELSLGNCPPDPSHLRWAPPSYDAEGGTNFQGTAPAGGIVLVRPMLGMTRKEIEEYASEHGVEYREDRTNAENEYKRNRVRNVVFPEFEKINPSFIRTFAEDMEHFRQVDDIAEDYFRSAQKEIWTAPDSVSVQGLLGLKHRRYVIFRLLERFSFAPAVIAEVSALVEKAAAGEDITFSGKTFSSPTHLLRTAPGRLVIRPLSDAGQEESFIVVQGPGRYTFAGSQILVEEFEFSDDVPLKQPRGTLLCDADALGFPFILRNRMAGDWLRPFGMGGRAKKLSDLFTDLKLTGFEKDSAVIAVSPAPDPESEGHVAAVLGLRMDEALRVTKGSVRCIRISLI